MIRLRNMAAAFLYNEGKVLLIKRSLDRGIAPGVWCGIGGHIEPCEINDPYAACLREIQEETGITKTDISSLKLLYIITRRSKDEIRQNYIYFGETSKKELVKTNEGELLWIPENKVLDREFSKTYDAMLRHYLKRDMQDRNIYVGTAGISNNGFAMCFSKLEDFE